MNNVYKIMLDLPVNDLSLYAEMGELAGKKGNLEESVYWFLKGLSKARELKDQASAKKFSALIALSL